MGVVYTYDRICQQKNTFMIVLNLLSGESFKNHVLAMMGEKPYQWAAQHGIGRRIIDSIKKGNIPDPKNLVPLANALGVSVDYILTGNKATLPHSKEQTINNREGYIVPLAEGYLSGGTGTIPSDEIKDELWIPKKYLGAAKGAETRYVAIEVKGNSMEPIVQEGEIVVVDRTECDPEKIRSRSIYAVRVDSENYVKHLLYKKKENVLQLISANPQFVREHGIESIDLNTLDDSPIIGKVVFSFRRWK